MDVEEARNYLGVEITGLSPEIAKQKSVDRLLMEADSAALARLSSDMIIAEALVEATEHLSDTEPIPAEGPIPLKLPATRHFIKRVREMSPGLDGLGRGEAVRILEASSRPVPAYYPAAGIPAEEKGPGLVERITSFFGLSRKGGHE